MKIVLEEDDAETIAAAKALNLDARFEIIAVAPAHPRTKPRACNYAMRFVRGDHVVIYDAEDRPEPDQLKKAIAAFRAAPSGVACLQARLNVYNAERNWLTRMFELEYAGWFDFLLPGLARLGIPIPLGGTSNHFRVGVLRSVYGWDAFNVTEDADLGVRLARAGYRVLPIDSSTFEEASPTLKGWVRQRSRWLKGYMQTSLVHLRDPADFIRTVGFLPFAGFVVFVLGAVMTSLLAPFFWMLALALALWAPDNVLGAYGPAVSVVSYVNLIAGNLLLTLLAVLAPVRRRWLHLALYGLGVCLYWLLISAAAYKALVQLCCDPFRWEKTEHGIAENLRPVHQWRPLLARFAPIIIVLACFASEVAKANPWPKAEGASEIIQSLTMTRQEAGLAGGAEQEDVTLHGEFGAETGLTAILHSDFQRQTTAEGNRNNFDNAVAGLRKLLFQEGDSVVSAEIDAGLAGVRRSALTPDMGLNGRAEARAMFGEGFDLFGRHGFAGVEAGWRWRGGAPADELVLDTGAGIEPWEGGLLMLQSFSIRTTGTAKGAYTGYSLSKLQLSLAQSVGPHVWLQFGILSVVAGSDRGETGLVLSFWERF